MAEEEKNEQQAETEMTSFVDEAFGGEPETGADHSQTTESEDGLETFAEASAPAGEGADSAEAKTEPEKQDEDETARLNAEVERLKKRLHDTQASYHEATAKRNAAEKELAELKAKKDDDDDWFSEEDENGLKTAEENLRKADAEIADINETERAISEKQNMLIWEAEVKKVSGELTDFEEVVYKQFAPLIDEKTGEPSEREAWLKAIEKLKAEGKASDPRFVYGYAKDVLERREFERDPKAYKERLRKEIQNEKNGMNMPDQISVQPTGKRGLDMVQSAAGPGDQPSVPESFVDGIF